MVAASVTHGCSLCYMWLQVRLLANLTRYVPAMRGWEGQWNLDAEARYLVITPHPHLDPDLDLALTLTLTLPLPLSPPLTLTLTL